MKRKIITLATTLFLTSGSSFALEAPDTCPSAAALANPGFQVALKTSTGWNLFTQSNKFGTNYDWSLGIGEPLSANSAEEALTIGTKALTTATIITPQPVEYDDEHYACGYGSENMLIGTITPALQSPPADYRVFRHA